MFNYIGVKFLNDNVNGKNVVAINYNLFIFLLYKIIKIELKIKLHHPNFLGILPMPTKSMKGVSSPATQNKAGLGIKKTYSFI